MRVLKAFLITSALVLAPLSPGVAQTQPTAAPALRTEHCCYNHEIINIDPLPIPAAIGIIYNIMGIHNSVQ